MGRRKLGREMRSSSVQTNRTKLLTLVPKSSFTTSSPIIRSAKQVIIPTAANGRLTSRQQPIASSSKVRRPIISTVKNRNFSFTAEDAENAEQMQDLSP